MWSEKSIHNVGPQQRERQPQIDLGSSDQVIASDRDTFTWSRAVPYSRGDTVAGIFFSAVQAARKNDPKASSALLARAAREKTEIPTQNDTVGSTDRIYAAIAEHERLEKYALDYLTVISAGLQQKKNLGPVEQLPARTPPRPPPPPRAAPGGLFAMEFLAPEYRALARKIAILALAWGAWEIYKKWR